MDNYQIAENFSLLSKLMDIHGENSFKAKSKTILAAKRIFAILKSICFIDTYYTYINEKRAPRIKR